MTNIPQSIADFAEAAIISADRAFGLARAAADQRDGAAGVTALPPDVARKRVSDTGGDVDALQSLCADALLEAEWWNLRRREPGGRFLELFRAELARADVGRRDSGEATAALKRRVIELEAECAALRAMPALTPAAASPDMGADDAIAALVACRVSASVERAEAWGLEIGGKWTPYTAKEVGYLRSAHRFMVLHGLADAVDRFPMPGAAPSRVSTATGLQPAPVPAARPAAPVAAAPAAPKGRLPRAAKPKQEAAEEQNALFG
ncbi:MAG: hypothetical protein RLZZ373_3266 [Pseudomonadota bacterium]|jgi:hypothetical protein